MFFAIERVPANEKSLRTECNEVRGYPFLYETILGSDLVFGSFPKKNASFGSIFF